MYMNYKEIKKYILVFSPFLSLEPERKKRRKEERNFREENVDELSCT